MSCDETPSGPGSRPGPSVDPGAGRVEVVYFDLGDTLVDPRTRSWISGARGLLRRLAPNGPRLGVISNTGELDRTALARLLPPDFTWSAFEDGLILLSQEVGIEKPDPAIFRLAVACAGVPPAGCLFCTENLTDTLAAQEVGLRAVRVLPDRPGDYQRLGDRLVTAT